MFHTTFHRLGAAFAVLALLFAACGDDDDTASESVDLDEVGEAFDPSDADGAQEAVNAAESAGFISGDCADALGAFIGAQADLASGFTAMGGGSAEADYDAFADGVRQLADRAPDEIASEFEVWAEALSTFFEGLADIDFTPGQGFDEATMEQFQALNDAIDTEEFDQAQDAIGDWFDANCQ